MAQDPRMRYSIGLCLHKMGLLEEAIEEFSAALEFDPLFTGWEFRGKNKKKKKNLHKARIRKNNFVELQTEIDADAYVARGNALMDYGHEDGHKRSRRDYARALHDNPYNVTAAVNMAFNLQSCGRCVVRKYSPQAKQILLPSFFYILHLLCTDSNWRSTYCLRC